MLFSEYLFLKKSLVFQIILTLFLINLKVNNLYTTFRLLDSNNLNSTTVAIKIEM